MNYKQIVYSFQNETTEPVGKLVNGKKQGEWKTFYWNGKLKLLSHYVNDTLNGTYMAYYSNGNPRYKATYKKGILVDSNILYNYNGTINLAGFKNALGNDDGVFKIYNDKGIVIQIGKYRNGHFEDTSKTYFNSGKLKTIEFYADNKKAGRWEYFDENGRLVKIETYKDDSLINSESKLRKPSN